MKRIVLELDGLDCAGCADQIQQFTSNMDEVDSANLNFVNKKMNVEIKDESQKDKVISDIKSIVKKLEPGVKVIDRSVENKEISSNIINLQLEELYCAGCADQIEQITRDMEDVADANLNFVNKKFQVKVKDPSRRSFVVGEIISVVKKLEPGVKVIDLDKSDKESKSKDLVLLLDGLDCAGCAGQIEDYTKKMDGIEEVSLDFVSKKMRIKLEDSRRKDTVINNITKEMAKLEPHVKVIDTSKKTKIDRNIELEEDKSKERKQLFEIILGAGIFALPTLLGLEGNNRFIAYFISYLIVGHDVIKTAFVNLFAGNAMDEHFLMTIATIAAFITGEYPEGVMVMLLYKVGEYLQGLAVNHSRRSIASAMNIRPDSANLVSGDDILEVSPDEIEIGDIILIRPGERVPLDGIVVEGESTLDTSNITGESVPRSIKVGEEIISGVVNNSGLLKVEVTKEFGESTVTKILDLIENASSKKAPTENFITKFSRYYTPIVVVLATIIAIIPSLVTGDWGVWLYRAAVFLVISCPCALVISVPLGFFSGIGAASKEGVSIKGGNYLEALTDVDTIVFDKTGTITKGSFDVTKVITYSDYKEEDILEIGAYGEVFSNHPIGNSIVRAYDKDIRKEFIDEYKEIAGKGVSVQIKEKNILLGNESLLKDNNIKVNKEDSIGTLVYVAEDSKHIGTIIVADELKDGIKETLEDLRAIGIKETIMLSGDNVETVNKVAEVAGVDKAYGDLLPQDKVEIFEDIMSYKPGKSKVAFVGDGVNDAPVLARADVGIGMGGLGSDAAIEASDIVIMTDEIHKIATTISIANKTKKIVMQNIILALVVKLVVLLLGALGHASMWQAVFADVGVSIIAIFNSMRALRVDKKYK